MHLKNPSYKVWRDGTAVTVLDVLPEDTGLNPSIHMVAYNCNSSSGRSTPFSYDVHTEM